MRALPVLIDGASVIISAEERAKPGWLIVTLSENGLPLESDRFSVYRFVRR